MNVFLQAQKLFGIVDGSLPRELSEDLKEWNDRNVACQSILISSIDPKLQHRFMTCRTTNKMWRATENVQLLQQKFFEFKMKLDTDVGNHISYVKHLANQLSDVGEPISEQAIIYKNLCTWSLSFRHMQRAWDSVPHHKQTLDALTFPLVKEESYNHLQKEDEDGESVFFSSNSKGSGTNPK